MYGLNASGNAPMGISAEILRKAGHKEMPALGWPAVNVPGTPSAWAALSARFGKLPLSEVVRPAVEYAEQGFPISPVIGTLWKNQEKTFKAQSGRRIQILVRNFRASGQGAEESAKCGAPGPRQDLCG